MSDTGSARGAHDGTADARDAAGARAAAAARRDEQPARAALPAVTLEPLAADDREQFVRDNQEAFNYGALEEFGRLDDHFEDEAGGQIISRETIERSIDEGCALRVKLDGASVGDLVVRVDGDHGDLDLLFVSPHIHSRGVGQAAWQAVERRFPQVRVWELVTPYFEKRNIHFYVNRCGFHIVEFYNAHYPDPHGNPEGDAGSDAEDGGPDEMFRFEKVMY